MVKLRQVWMVKSIGTLSTRLLGSRLDVQLSGRAGFFSFAVIIRLDGASPGSCVLAQGERPSAMQAMAAAERAAAELSCKLPLRPPPEPQLHPVR